MTNLTHIIPTPEIYKEYVRQRNERTQKAMDSLKVMSGSYIKENNLSLKMLFDNGYTFDGVTDSMIKE